ncbi:hypothetical protein CALCODRAFT_497803 [Calocera cornea HHB12733]|uniref:Uncharacterized protein n=1 Tax=Calocera cornea HHB12733 TaxID=1353952 RepID=A0A165F3C5_9BASI|nr:hypothetical protein CALCODRAFT_497803 [Calocera cornea HHB12733]
MALPFPRAPTPRRPSNAGAAVSEPSRRHRVVTVPQQQVLELPQLLSPPRVAALADSPDPAGPQRSSLLEHPPQPVKQTVEQPVEQNQNQNQKQKQKQKQTSARASRDV